MCCCGSIDVGTSVDYLEVDLNWGDTTDSLSLTIYTSGGSNLGTFYDNDDGVICEVYGASVIGTEGYSFNVYNH